MITRKNWFIRLFCPHESYMDWNSRRYCSDCGEDVTCLEDHDGNA
jgi:hypothetical protein